MIKLLIKKFLPITFISAVIAILKGYRYKLNQKNEYELNKNKKIAIFANSPSLPEDIKKLSDYNFIMGVNHLADTNFFTDYKPTFYILQDYYFWDTNVSENYIHKRHVTFSNLNEKTDWHIDLFLPSFANLGYIKKVIKNKNITIKVFNGFFARNSQNIYPSIFKPSKLIIYLWKKNFLCPPPINIACTALYLSSLLGFKSIYLFGCEMSYFKTLFVNSKDNRLFAKFKHFYGEEKLDLFKYKNNKVHSNISFELKKWAYIFEGFSNMSYYLKSQNVKVINCSSKSYLDCFDRK